MKRKPHKSIAVLKVPIWLARKPPRISVREIARLTGCESLEVKKWAYHLYPQAFQDVEDGKPIYLTWAEARKVLSRLFEDTNDPGDASRLLCLDDLLAREGPFREGCHVIGQDKVECKVTREQVYPRKDFDRLFPNSELQVCANGVLYLDSRQIDKLIRDHLQVAYGRKK